MAPRGAAWLPLAAAALAAATALAPSALAQDCSLLGDVNGDGSLDIVDAVKLVRLSLNPTAAEPDVCPMQGDMNMDGAYNVVDAVLLLQQILDGDGGEETERVPGASSDPHFVGLNGAEYDVTGTSGKYYSIVSDKDLSINAKFETAWTTGFAKEGGAADFSRVVAKGTWMTEVAVVVPGHSIVVSAKPAPGVGDECDRPECFNAGSLVVDGTAAAYYGMAQVANWGRVDSTADGVITITSSTMELTVKIAGPQSEWGIPEAEAPLYSHCNLTLNRVDLSDHAHGLLGYTARASAGTAAFDAEGAGVLEGSVTEYEVASATATDFTYSQF